MKNFRSDRAFMLLFALITLSFTTSSFTSRFGLDSYEIYLDNKLVSKHYVNQPLNLRVLQLDKAKENGQLKIGYTHCMSKGNGTGRSLTLKDEDGHLVHTWPFADTTVPEAKMAIAVKDLLAEAKKNTGHELSLYYTARETPKGEMLSMIRFK
ncbi:hypothetical protein [Hufsiella ginkgonis]|uniref:Uncharacterized protein n=1 Tax=Hufsiella ginkgonis TaxID=2695274 RepID=A0A7K1Y092_9SPHI|nr:hypothetical protein [Hufsiella ginkgonis]MXV16488.1 hypothetical protein [Hufsiella ginkgonis]